jgi:hypothetical protein
MALVTFHEEGHFGLKTCLMLSLIRPMATRTQFFPSGVTDCTQKDDHYVTRSAVAVQMLFSSEKFADRTIFRKVRC